MLTSKKSVRLKCLNNLIPDLKLILTDVNKKCLKKDNYFIDQMIKHDFVNNSIAPLELCF